MTYSALHLHQLVKTNGTSFAPAVDFGMMDKPEQNRQLCQGFIFNYEADQPKTSTVGVLDALRRGFHSQSEPNIHLMVQDYGKGKSHFALTVANFFQQPPDSPEVAGILDRVTNAVGSETVLVQQLRSYKQRGRHLVFCLSAVDVFDLRQTFLDVVRKTLKNEGITGTKAQRLVERPLEFLNQVINNTEEKAQAEAWLQPQGYGLVGLINKLNANDVSVVPIVSQLCEKLRRITPDFRPHVDIKEVLDDLIQNYCRGANAPYQGILIIFDELHKYLQQWAADPIVAGNAALQSLTEICENNKTSISLLCLSIRRPLTFTPSKNQEDYKLLASRLELTNSTYEPAASLELVLKNLIQQKEDTSAWQEFYSKHQNTLQAESQAVYRDRTHSYYASHNWDESDFRDNVGVGCFPLHPLTTYLLCNLNFTQGRRILQFVEADRNGIAKFVQDQPAEISGKPNFLRPVALVDAFEDNFANPEANTQYIGLYGNYCSALTKLKAAQNVAPEEFLVLKALFLFYASIDKLTAGPHSEILAMMTGLASPRVRQLLNKLHQERRVIYPDTAGEVYDFFRDGADPDSLRQKLREATATTEADIALVIDHCQKQLEENRYVTRETSPRRFIHEKRLRPENWFFQNRVVSIATLRTKLNDTTWLKDLQDADARGRVVYTFAETSEEIAALKQEIEQLLEQSPLKDRLVIAIANQPTGNLARQILELNHLSTITQENNAASDQIRKDYGKQIHERVSGLFKSCTYYCDPNVFSKIPAKEQVRCEAVVSALLEDRYPLAPPVANNDKMTGKSNAKVLRDIMMQLLVDNLRPPFSNRSYDNVIDQVLIPEWKILQKQGQMYRVIEPDNREIKAAWDKISELTSLKEQQDERVVSLLDIWHTLNGSPFGYHEHVFTALLSAWLAAHSSEVVLRGKGSLKNGSRLEQHAVKAWVENTEIFSKANELMNWIRKGNAQLVRRKPAARPEIPGTLDYDKAKTLIGEIEKYLEFESDTTSRAEAEATKKSLKKCVQQIDQTYKPCQEALAFLQSSSQNQQLTELLSHYQQLSTTLFTAKDDSISVIATTQQQTCQAVRQRLSDAIEQAIQKLLLRQSTLKSQHECNAYTSELTNSRKQIEAFPEFTRFIDDIDQASSKVKENLSFIQETEKCQETLDRIQVLYSGLSSIATQSDYEEALNKIDSEAQKTPLITQYKEYQHILENINARQQKLNAQLQEWNSSVSEQASKRELASIRDAVVSNKIQYTNTESKQYIETLLVKIDDGIRAREQAEREIQYQDREHEITELFKQLPIERQNHLIKVLMQLKEEKERNNSGR